MFKYLEAKELSKIVLKLICPPIFGDSIERFTSDLFILPNFNWKSSLVIFVINLYYFIFVTEGFLYKFINTRFLFLPTRALGPFESAIHGLWGITIFELIILRAHCLYKMVRHGRSSLAWYDISTKIKISDHPTYFIIFRLLFFGIFGGCLVAILFNHALKITEQPTYLDYVVNMAWIIIQILLLRFAMVEFPYFYIVGFSCYIHVKDKMDNLLRNFNEPILDIDLVSQYLKLIKLIKIVNPLMRLILFTNGLTVIPHFSIIFMIFVTHPENTLQFFCKYVHVLPGIFYSVRGMILTIVLAKIDYRSRCLYKQIASRIARGNVTGYITHKQLLVMMDDLSSNKNHLVMREYSGSPSTQMDVMMNVFAIAQFSMLLMDFSVGFNLSPDTV